jgi:hypothetical protein
LGGIKHNDNCLLASSHKKVGGKERLSRSKIKPIAQRIVHLMLWQTGAAQEYFRSLEENGNLSDNNDDDESDNE